MTYIKNHFYMILGFIFIFIFIFIYFSKVNPVIPFDTDDWYVLNLKLPALPFYNSWIPARVFPNFFAPMIGDFGTFFIKSLFSVDYLTSIQLSLAFFLALFSSFLYITLFLLLEAVVAKKSFSLLISLSIFSMFFSFNGNHMMYSYDFTCYVSYIIPNLMNASLICILMRKYVLSGRINIEKGFRCGWVISLVYFSIFSILFSSAILISFIIVYCGFLWFMSHSKKFSEKIKKYLNEIKNNSMTVLIIILFLVSVLIEVNGDRANNSNLVSTDINAKVFFRNFLEAMFNFIRQIGTINSVVLSFSLFILLIATIQFIKHYKDDCYKPIIMLLRMSVTTGALLIIILSLISAKAGIMYSTRYDVFFNIGFILFLSIAFSVIYLSQRIKKIETAVPIIFIVLISTMFPFGLDSGVSVYKQRLRISSYIINEMLIADKTGASECNIEVPNFGGDNWPLSITNTNGLIGQTLYRHGVISRQITDILVPNESKNEMLNH